MFYVVIMFYTLYLVRDAIGVHRRTRFLCIDNPGVSSKMPKLTITLGPGGIPKSEPSDTSPFSDEDSDESASDDEERSVKRPR